MTNTADVYISISAPPVVPRPHGLFSVAPPAPGGDHWEMGVRWINSPGCALGAQFTIDECINGTPPDPFELDASYCDSIRLKPFSVYVYGRRSGPGSYDVAEAEINAILAASEERAVENALWQEMIAGGTPVDTPGTLLDALAYVEYQLGRDYNGRGVIHMSRFAAIALSKELFVSGAQLQTRLGTPVVAGAGYGPPLAPGPPAAPPAEVTGFIFGTGELVSFRGPIDSNMAVDRAINDFIVLAQRPYTVGWDCALVQARVTATV